ncbi:uncharacterized protein LOC116289690 isoform X2 [Actinia tenebrosa]|uniref:Uncharacterized protein LOC116289690 isoform X2 n=1 Tax=Actinia tenebrosa TaxID=6105 RepID=A0A6P8HIM3_ACTTE|nr:uncharacterized protein LOC116289690 isoform X2 [Actinia tenebrosa]
MASNNDIKIRKNEERIADLEKQLRVCLRKEKKHEDEIKALKKKIQDLEEENKELAKQLQEIKASKDRDDSVLILIQIGTTMQRNMCKYVLGKCFETWRFYKFKKINSYIEELGAQPADQISAKQRLTELNQKISWDQNLVDSLKNLNQTRIGIAHPELSSEKIQKATEVLREIGELDDELVVKLNTLKGQWKTSEEMLNRAAGGPEDGPEGGTMNWSTAGQSQDTYASRAAGGSEDGPEGGTMNLSTAGQSQDTYASRAAGGLYLDTKA